MVYTYYFLNVRTLIHFREGGLSSIEGYTCYVPGQLKHFWTSDLDIASLQVVSWQRGQASVPQDSTLPPHEPPPIFIVLALFIFSTTRAPPTSVFLLLHLRAVGERAHGQTLADGRLRDRGFWTQG